MRPLFFDVDGVLIHGFHAKQDKQIRWDKTIEADLGIERARMSAEFFARDFLSDVIIGRMDLKEALGAWLNSTDYDVSPDQLVDYWMEKDSHINWGLLFFVTQIRTARLDLKGQAIDNDAKAGLFLATNQEHYRAQYLWDSCGFRDHFDDIFYSARLGVMKPEPLYFQKIEEALDFGDQRPLFFDDRDENVKAARDQGWEAVLYKTIDDLISHPYIKEILQTKK